jgi:hypothetical protein
MPLTAITDRRRTKQAFESLKRRLYNGARRYVRNVGYQGESLDLPVWWREDEGFWSTLRPIENRYWVSFGTTDPLRTNALSIACEINPPLEGVNKSIAGMFATDSRRRICLTHSGKIGGGRRGVGQTAFLEQFRGADAMAGITMPDGSVRPMIVIGAVDDPSFPAQVGHFVREVERVKALLTATEDRRSTGAPPRTRFSPEFAGKRRPYLMEGAVEADAKHGLVVEEIARLLAERNRRYANDRNRDLYILDGRGRMTHLFEVKTGVDSTSVYTAVGQLMLNGEAEAAVPRRMLILPARPDRKTAAALAKLGIEVVTYEWRDNRPVFRHLDQLD